MQFNTAVFGQFKFIYHMILYFACTVVLTYIKD